MTGFSVTRIYAMALRYLYLLRRSPMRIIELIYWPFMNLAVWGFITVYLRSNTFGITQAAGLFLGAVVLWEILIRSNLGMTVTFVEEFFSRNLGHLFISPLRPYELLIGCMVTSFVRTLVSMLPAVLILVPLFGYSIFSLGAPLIAFYLILSMFGWAFGMFIMAILIRSLRLGRHVRHHAHRRRLLSGVGLAGVVAARGLVPAQRLCL